VAVSQGEYKQDQTVLVTVYNNQPYVIYLQGCNPYILERSEGDAWVERHAVRCVWEGEAIPINPLGNKEFEIPIESREGLEGTYRVKVPYWYACRETTDPLPVSEMECGEKRDVYSETFRVKAE